MAAHGRAQAASRRNRPRRATLPFAPPARSEDTFARSCPRHSKPDRAESARKVRAAASGRLCGGFYSVSASHLHLLKVPGKRASARKTMTPTGAVALTTDEIRCYIRKKLWRIIARTACIPADRAYNTLDGISSPPDLPEGPGGVIFGGTLACQQRAAQAGRLNVSNRPAGDPATHDPGGPRARA